MLPANVYPEPLPKPEVASQPIAAAASGPSADESERVTPVAAGHDVLGELVADEKQKREAPQPEKKPKDKTKKEKRAKPEPERLVAGVPLRQRLRRVFSPFTLILVGMGVVVFATISWQVHQGRVESASFAYDSSRDEALEALDARDFETAAPLLRKAVDAADLLERTDGHANHVRRLNSQVDVMLNLSSLSMFDFVDRLSDRSRDPGELVRGIGSGWFVLDTYVVPGGRNAEGLRQFEVEIPIVSEGTRVRMMVVGGEFESLGMGSSGARVIFAAKIAECRHVGQDRIVLDAEPDSVRLWTDAGLFAELGFHAEAGEAGTIAVLDRQAEALGVER